VKPAKLFKPFMSSGDKAMETLAATSQQIEPSTPFPSTS
jgi:hypothetical protein